MSWKPEETCCKLASSKRPLGDDGVKNPTILTWLQKENLKRETQSLLIAAQNNALRTNYIKIEIDNK